MTEYEKPRPWFQGRMQWVTVPLVVIGALGLVFLIGWGITAVADDDGEPKGPPFMSQEKLEERMAELNAISARNAAKVQEHVEVQAGTDLERIQAKYKSIFYIVHTDEATQKIQYAWTGHDGKQFKCDGHYFATPEQVWLQSGSACVELIAPATTVPVDG